MRSLRLLLAIAVFAFPPGVRAQSPSTIGPAPLSSAQLRANAATNRAALGLSQFSGAPYRAPTSTDDVTTGVYPGMVTRVGGQSYLNISNGAGQAIWQKMQSLPMPADVIGYYVTAAAVNGGGSGYVAGDVGKTLTLQGGVVLTIATVSAGAVATVNITTANMIGVCSPTTTAAPILTNSGTTGSGATFNLTLAYPTIYSVRRVSRCYTGNIVHVTNSVTQQGLAIGYLADNSMDINTALSFSSNGTTPPDQYANYTDGPMSNVDTWYDQGGNPSPNNATQATLAQMPVLFGSRKFGNSVPVLFNSQGPAAGGMPFPSVTSMAVPTGVTAAGLNAAVIFAGGSANANASWAQLNATAGGSGTQYFGVDDVGGTTCYNSNSTNTSSQTWPPVPDAPETPIVVGCSWTAGALAYDSSFGPATSLTENVAGTDASGSTVSIAAATASACPLTANHTVSYQSTGAGLPADTAGLIAAINADATFAAAGITAAPGTFSNTDYKVYNQLGSNCTLTPGATGALTNGYRGRAGGNWTFAGGTLGSVGSYSGASYQAFVAFVPWAMTNAQMQMVRWSIDQNFEIDGRAGIRIQVLAASNTVGYLTPFLQDLYADLPRLLGRDDVAIWNNNQSGYQLGTYVSNWNTGSNNTAQVALNYGLPSRKNNFGIVQAEYNSMTAAGAGATEYATMQTLAGYFHAAGWQTICTSEIMKNVTTIQAANNTQLAALLDATPGACDAVIDFTKITWMNNAAGPWNWPLWTKSGPGSHVSAMGNQQAASIIAEKIRGMIQ